MATVAPFRSRASGHFRQLAFEQLFQVFRQVSDVVLALIVGAIRRLQRSDGGIPIFTNAFWNGPLASQNFALLHANEIVASGSGGSAVTLNERVNSIQIPKSKGGKAGRVLEDRPILVDDGEEGVHPSGNGIKVRRDVIAHPYRSFPVTAAELTNVGDRRIVERPKGVFVEGLDAFLEADLA